MKTILIDDEPMALEVLENMLLAYEDIDVVGRYTRPSDSIEDIIEIEPDIIFLDIEIGDMNGLELAEIFMERFSKAEIVFVTAYSQYAVDAFELNAIDYLLKPIQEKRLLKAIERLRIKIKENHLIKKESNILENKLKLQSFGGFQVKDSMGNPLKWRTQKSKELLAYLWEKEKCGVSKFKIMEDIFPHRDLDKAGTLLHTTIYQLRTVFRGLGFSNTIIYINESYGLNIPIESDLEDFRKITNLKTVNNKDIKELLNIYRGDYLEEGYSWAMESQQKYSRMFISKIEEFARQKLLEKRLDPILKDSLDKAYEIDPFNEILAEMMIHYFGIKYNKSDLEDFFSNYEKDLWEEMKLEPTVRILNIYKEYMEEA